MKWAKIRILAVAASIICSASNLHSEEIKGEVFIVTKGGDNKRLGRVSVRVLDFSTAAASVVKKSQAAAEILPQLRAMKEKAKADSDKVDILSAEHKERFQTYLDWLCVTSYYGSGRFYFADLPDPIAETKTDSDGKYSVTVPAPGQYALAAVAERTIGSSEEHYYWLISVTVKSGSATDGTLSNDNLASANSNESMITTCSPTLEADNAVKGAKIAVRMVAKLKEPVRAAAQPLPPQSTPKPKSAKEAQDMAVRKYPDLGVAGSALNRAFLAKVQQYKAARSAIFDDPAWPLIIAEECAH